MGADSYWAHLTQQQVMYSSLGVSVLFYIVMFVLMETEYDIYNSDFFYITVNSENSTQNPVVLGVPLRNKGQQIGLCIFFALNAFLGVLNSVLVDGLFGMMVYDSGPLVISEILQMYGGQTQMLLLFIIYDVWKSARVFFSILGMYSNVVFFASTTLGALVGGLVTKLILLSRFHFLKVELHKCNKNVLLPAPLRPNRPSVNRLLYRKLKENVQETRSYAGTRLG